MRDAPVPIPHPLWNVSTALQEAGVTQAALARRLGISDGHLSNMIRGLREVTVAEISQIDAACRALGVVDAIDED